ncbi:probable LRR receptor-like serine/threonine-protein kinase At3g47570 [Hibiscus syriacus]|uniref:probable LRR receptor-like serine/threonine-protein kinase At3g47570 n=1 Tax=Hibiscus syriacus TaxID=106335 RepID=UPI001920BFED|nr:probable LRR receptor-like serine/threonine-protein kinase At3g47570 [Hibiscus syriacus]
MANGSLENWLHPSTSINEPETIRNLDFFQRVNVANDVAHALEFLHHHCVPSIIHCDLKPNNILLDEEMVGHISDFGLAKILSADMLNYSTNQSNSLGLRGTIAVKVLNLLNHGASRSFLIECEALKNIRHRNIVKVLTAISGIDYQGNDFKALVYEFMENGTLEDWLHPSVHMNEPETKRNMNFFQRVNVAIDVAHALEYLHHRCGTSTIHCDLKPSNILLDQEMVGHLSDFGLTKFLSVDGFSYPGNQSSSLGIRGTIGYAPPEYGMGRELSTKGDVYSYGILLLEMFIGKRPTDERFKEGLNLHNFVKADLPKQMIKIVDPTLFQERVRQGNILDITLSGNSLGNRELFWCLNSVLEIGLACSAESPSERMDMSNVVTKLCSIRDKLRPPQLHCVVRT